MQDKFSCLRKHVKDNRFICNKLILIVVQFLEIANEI